VQPDFPVVLKGATVLDGTGAPGYRAHVAIYGALISAVDRACRIKGEVELDLDGLVLAPGFIDTHSHSDLFALARPALEMKARQGCTLDVLGQDGISVAPAKESDIADMKRQLAGLLGEPNLPWKWRTVGEYLDALEGVEPAIDLAYLVPHGSLRRIAMGMEDRPATADEIAVMERELEQGLKDGAVGMSTGLIYPPCCYAPTEELIALCKVVARYRGAFVVHMRSESDRIVEATREMMRVGRESGVHVHISHFKIAGGTNWDKIDKVFAEVDEARAQGVEVTADQYPYIAGSTMLGAILPPWAHAGGLDATLERLKSKEQRAKMRADMLCRDEVEWDNFWKWGGPEAIRVADVPSGKRPELLGKNLKDAAGNQDPVEFAMDLLLGERMGVAMVSFSQCEPVIEKILKQPYTCICTDGLLGGKPHPRAFGTFPRLLGRYVRERGVLTLEEAVHKATYLAAKTFRLAGAGQIKKGWRANLVVFDPKTVLDRATFEDPKQFGEGMPYVFVEGQAVVAEGESTEARPGRTVRAMPVEEPW
jgi:N-acyl-D-amino-acid deacylase